MSPAPPGRTARLRTALGQMGLDAYLSQRAADVTYLTGSWGFPAAVYVPAEQRDEPCLLVVPAADLPGAVAPGAYTLRAVALDEPWPAAIAAAMDAAGRGMAPPAAGPAPVSVGRLAVSGLGGEVLGAARARARRVDESDLLDRLRRRWGRDTDEREGLARARRIALAGLRSLLGTTRAGLRECDLVGPVEEEMRRARAEGLSPSRFAAGPRSAHANPAPSARVLRAGDMGFAGVGPVWEGYASEITRAFHLGPPPPEALRLIDGLRRAREAAIALLQPGRTGGDVFRRVAALLEAEGLGGLLPHRLGAPLGGLLHPMLAPGEREALVVGDMLTVDPGLYVAGLGGVRIGDAVEVTASGPVVLSETVPGWTQIVT